MIRPRGDWTIVTIVLVALALSLAVSIIPGWIRYISQIAIAAALASVGVMILLRAGLLSFGQSLFYFLGGYCVAFLNKHFGMTDAVATVLVGAFCAGTLAMVLGAFIARYRGIFFSMLTLAISMVVYGIATKMNLLGGSDGLNIGAMSFFGYRPRGPDLQTASFLLCVWTLAVFGIGAHIFLRSRLGKVMEAIEDNEIRLEYLGQSVRAAIHIAYVVAGVLAGAGGALAGISARHVDPSFAYWTTAGDFIFIVLLSGQTSVLSPFAGSLLLEILRMFASALFPDQWQLALGAVMLAIVLFLPSGLDHVFVMIYRALRRQRVARLPEQNAVREIAEP
jgi:ABC-type branched-subunit amino acid transport system permease subunit